MNIDQRNDSRLRHLARNCGLGLRKSRITSNYRNRGGWRIVDPESNLIIEGEAFDLDDREVETWLQATKARN